MKLGVGCGGGDRVVFSGPSAKCPCQVDERLIPIIFSSRVAEGTLRNNILIIFSCQVEQRLILVIFSCQVAEETYSDQMFWSSGRGLILLSYVLVKWKRELFSSYLDSIAVSVFVSILVEFDKY